MRIVVTAEAEAELASARDWYDEQTPGTGMRFMTEYRVLLDRLADNPRQFQAIRGDVRRAGFRHFPYGLFFRLGAAEIEVFACFHASRRPRRWQRRA